MNLDDLYFKDNFTKDGDKVDLEISKLTTSCITSKNNRFNLDVNGNLSVNSITTEVPIVTESQIDVLYPVGSIYMNVNPINPNVVLGGSWERIKDTFLLACGDTYINGTTGGHNTVTLNEDHLPMGALRFHPNNDGRFYSQYFATSTMNFDIGYVNAIPFNIMPPYLAVNVWKRIA